MKVNRLTMCFLDINESYTRIMGITREMAIGKRISEIMPDVQQYWIDIFGNAALTGEPNYCENYLGHADDYMYQSKLYAGTVIKNNTIDLIMRSLYEKKQQINDAFEKSQWNL